MYRLDRGVAYLAIYDRAAAAAFAGTDGDGLSTVERSFTLPPPEGARPGGSATLAPSVTAIYPSSGSVPQNLLRFYVHFSAPMFRGDAYSRVAIEDDSGAAVEGAFVEVREELWDAEATRLTLLFDPGRIKRDLRPNVEEGPPLEAGREYTLVVGPTWRAASGETLATAHRHRFAVGAPDRASPDPAAWQLSSPQAGSRDPLVVRFGEALDRPQALRWIWVETAEGRRLAGETTTAQGERAWAFTPDGPWRDLPYRLLVDARLEDLAGNRVAEPFEAHDRRTAATGPPIVTLPIVPSLPAELP